MMWGAAGQAVCYILISALLSQANGSETGTRFGAGAVAFFFLYYVFFGESLNIFAFIALY